MAIQFAPIVAAPRPVVQIGDLRELAIRDAQESRARSAFERSKDTGTLSNLIQSTGQNIEGLQNIQNLPAINAVQQGQLQNQLSQLDLDQLQQRITQEELQRKNQFFEDPVAAINQASAEDVFALYGQTFGQVPESISIPQAPRKMSEEEYLIKRAADANKHDFASDEDRRRFVQNEINAARAEYREQSTDNPEKFQFQPPPKTLTPRDPAFVTELRKKLNKEALDMQRQQAKIKAEAATPGAQFEVAQDLRKEYNALPVVKEYREAKNQFNSIRKNLSKPEPTAAADLASIFQFMKVLDPTSVVRESEFRAAQNTTGLPDKIWQYGKQLYNGTKLSPSQRLDFLNTSEAIFNERQSNFVNTVRQFNSQAEQVGIDPADVVPDDELSLVTGGAEQPATTAQSGAPVESIRDVTTAAEARSLPPNVRFFRDPRGRLFRNPNFQGQ